MMNQLVLVDVQIAEVTVAHLVVAVLMSVEVDVTVNTTFEND